MTARLGHFLLLLAILAAAAPGPALADDESQGAAAGLPLWYRLVKVPVEKWADWSPVGSYLGMDADEFEKMIGDIETASRVGRGSEAATITSSSYQAKLDGRQLVAGKAVLEISLRGGQPARLGLDPCGLAIGEATWSDKEGKPARLGSGGGKRLEVEVSEPGRLAFDWSLAGKQSSQGAIDFDLELPPSGVIHLDLDLPDGMIPVLERGIAVAGASVESGLSRWRIELGGHHRASLRVVPAADTNEATRLPHLRQSLTYDVSPLGVTLSASLQLDVLNEPVRQLALVTDADLRLVRVVYGEQSVSWSVAPTPGDDSTRRVIIEFPDPLQGTQRKLQIVAVAPLKLDQPWRLPGLRAEGVVWQQTEETVAKLGIWGPLLLEKLDPIRGRQSKPLKEELRRASIDGAPAEPVKVETVEVQYFAPDSGMEIEVSQPEAPLILDCGHTITMGGETTARVVADFRLERGERFSLEAEVTRQWIVKSVRSVPADLLEDWKFEDKNVSPRKLNLRLAKALSPDQPVHIEVTARRLRWSAGGEHAIRDLIPLRFDASDDGQRLIWLRVVEPYELKLRRDELVNWLSPASLDEKSLNLFDDIPGQLLFEDDSRAASLAVTLETRKPDYSAEIRAEVRVADDSTVESYRLQCNPNAGRIDRVLVRFSEPMTGDLHWDHGPEDEIRQLIDPKRPDDRTNGALREGRTWEIRLEPPRSTPFAISVTRTIQLTERRPISLACLPEASTQEGRVIVHSTGSTGVRIENDGLTQTPCDAAPIGQYSTAQATYSYDPVRDTTRETAPLTIAPRSTASRPPSAWAWDCQLQSCYQENGLGRHVATYRLQSAGKGRLSIALPPGMGSDSVDGVWIDGSQVAWREVADEGAEGVTVDLPAERKFPVVEIHFTADGPSLGHINRVGAPLPSVDVPVLSQQWTIWLPPGYAGLLDEDQRQATRFDSLSWPQRMFGPLGRPVNQSALDPFDLEDWAGLTGHHPTRDWATAGAVRLLEEISLQLHSTQRDRETDPIDWGTLLVNASNRALSVGVSDDLAQVLLIDQEAMARAEVTPQTTITTVSGAASAADGMVILNRANLVLLFCGEAILLTGADRAGVDGDQMQLLEDKMLWWVRPGRLRERIEAARTLVPGRQYIPVPQWAQRPAPAGSPWKTGRLSDRQPMDTLGWTAHRVDVTDGAPVEVMVIRNQTWQTARWITFLAFLSVGLWKLICRPAVVIAMAGAFALGVFLLPPLLTPLASGGLLAMLSVLGFRMTCSDSVDADSKDRSVNESESGLWSTAVIKVGVLILTVGLILAISSAARGQEPGTEPAAARHIHEVYVPVDESGEPARDKYWVSDVFSRELRSRAAALDKEPQGWLLSAATYRATLSWESTPRRLVLSDLAAVFDIELLDSEARVRIEPLVAAGVPLAVTEAKLDGSAVHPAWLEDDARIFDVQGRGRRRLELALRIPVVSTDRATSGIDLTIPPLARSRLELKFPPDAPEIEVPRAVGAVTRQEDPPLLVADLGATDRLTVKWRDASQLTVDELLWLKIRPSSVVLEARFKFHVGEGQLEQVSLTVDPRLVRQDPYKSDSVEVIEEDPISGRSPGEPHVVPLRFGKPVSGEVTIKAKLKLNNTLGIGNLLLPRLETRGAGVTKRWLAVSVEPVLEQSEEDSEHTESVSVPEFIEAWGEAGLQAPDASHNLTSAYSAWSTVTKLREPKTTADQTLAVTFSQEEAVLTLKAMLATEGGDRCRYVLSTPPGLVIDLVSVLQDDQERVARWATAGEDKTTVFLNAAVSGPHTMTLKGRLRSMDRPRMPLPVIRIEGVEYSSSRIQLRRQPQIQVDARKIGGLEEVEIDPAEEEPKEPGLLVKSFRVVPEEPVGGQVVVTPNDPKVRADQMTSLKHDGDSWRAEVDYHLKIGGGVVDELRLSIPPELTGPFEIKPMMEFEPPGESERQLIVRPNAPISGNYHFSISSPMEFVPAERESVPNIVLQNAELHTHRLVLPTQFQTRPVEWETRGLRKTELDDDSLPLLVAPESLVAYLVVGESFSAAIRPLGGSAEVYLADVCVAWHRGGKCHGVATFDLESANLLECPLRVPDGYRLVQATVAGAPVTPAPVAANRWLLPLGPNSLPQRIEVVFDGSISQPLDDGPIKVEAPVLGDLPVRQTLWALSGPSELKLQDENPDTVDSVTPLEHGRQRFENVTRLMEIAKKSTAEQSPDSGGWHEIYSRRRAAALRDAKRQLASAGETREANESAEVLRTAEMAQALAEPSIADEAVEVWRSTLRQPGWTTQCFIAQTSGPIILASPRADNGALSQRLTLSAWLAGVTFLAMVGVWRGTWTSLFRQWPHLCGVAFGLAWWVWLRPEVLGLLIVLLSLVLCFRSGWRKTGQSASAIVSLTLNER